MFANGVEQVASDCILELRRDGLAIKTGGSRELQTGPQKLRNYVFAREFEQRIFTVMGTAAICTASKGIKSIPKFHFRERQFWPGRYEGTTCRYAECTSLRLVIHLANRRNTLS